MERADSGGIFLPEKLPVPIARWGGPGGYPLGSDGRFGVVQGCVRQKSGNQRVELDPTGDHARPGNDLEGPSRPTPRSLEPR